MPCYHLQKAFKDTNGVRFVGPHSLWNIKLPCQQCWGCRLERSRQWAARCMHEASLHKYNCFVTTTYADEHLPQDGGLHKEDHQKFLKRLRKALSKGEGFHRSPTILTLPDHADMGLRPMPPALRYYMAGEYGEQLQRPHYHYCLFGIDLADKQYWTRTTVGNKLYRSATLERLWPYGYVTIGTLTFESAAYTARYVMKKINGQQKQKHYEKINQETGEIINIQPEYNEMSRANAIGRKWIDQYKADVYYALQGQILIRGKKSNAPRYYDKQLEKYDPERYELIHQQRITNGRANAHDNTPERLKVKEQVAKAKMRNHRRQI